MTFIGRLRRGSHLHRLWREQRRTSGIIAAIVFRFVQGDTYESDELPPAAVGVLQQHPDVELVSIAAPLPVLPVPAPERPSHRASQRNRGQLRVW